MLTFSLFLSILVNFFFLFFALSSFQFNNNSTGTCIVNKLSSFWVFSCLKGLSWLTGDIYLFTHSLTLFYFFDGDDSFECLIPELIRLQHCLISCVPLQLQLAGYNKDVVEKLEKIKEMLRNGTSSHQVQIAQKIGESDLPVLLLEVSNHFYF